MAKNNNDVEEREFEFNPGNVMKEFEEKTKDHSFHEKLDEEVNQKKGIDIVEALQPMDI